MKTVKQVLKSVGNKVRKTSQSIADSQEDNGPTGSKT